MNDYPELYIQFIYYFNIDRDYYECHEVMEELWLEEGRNTLYQGLLQVAVGLYHHLNGNVSGAIKLFEAGVSKLQSKPDQVLGIQLKKLRTDAAEYLEKLYHYEEKPFSFYDLDIDIIDPALEEIIENMKQELQED